MEALAWTPWRPLRLHTDISAEILAEQLDGGQSFRWTAQPDGSWTGVFGQTLARLRTGKQGLEWSAPVADTTAEERLCEYLDADGKQARLGEALPWRSDSVLRAAMSAHPGLRILRQDPHEALIGFLCSSNKRILQIRVMVAALASKLGRPLGGGFYAMPTWEALAEADDETLRSCSLGYRAAYIRETAKILKQSPRWETDFARLSTPDLMAALQELPGVGPKVAACVTLFGFARLESFPVDTWVVQALSSAYGLKDWKPERLEEFGRLHFGAAAGLAQQFIFSAARQGVLSAAPAPETKTRPKSRK